MRIFLGLSLQFFEPRKNAEYTAGLGLPKEKRICEVASLTWFLEFETWSLSPFFLVYYLSGR